MHFIAASLPLALTMAVIFSIWGGERDILEAFRYHKYENEAFRQVMFRVTDYTNLLMYAFYLGMLVWGALTRRMDLVRMVLGFAVIQFIVCFGVVSLVKVALGRPRPEIGGAVYELISLDHFYHSLPSGHTAEIFGAVTPLVLWFRRRKVTVLLGFVGALVGFSRIYLYQHYPSDVAFGWLFGGYAGWATFAYWKHARGTVQNPRSASRPTRT